MANSFVPFDLKLKAILGDTAVITWDVHNLIEFKKGTRYKVYISPDDSAYTFLRDTPRTETAIAINSSTKFVKVSSYHQTLGESQLSTAIKFDSPETLTEFKDVTPVATDGSGKSRALKIDAETGRLDVNAFINEEVLARLSTEGLATEAKQDAQNAALTSIITKQNSALINQQTQIDLLAELRASNAAGTLISSETVIEPVGTLGIKVTLPFYAKADIKQVTLLHEFGTATSFTLKIWRKKVSSSERDVLARFDSYDANGRLDIIKNIPYINLDNTDEITLQILPDNGTSNRFFLRVSGSLAI